MLQPGDTVTHRAHAAYGTGRIEEFLPRELPAGLRPGDRRVRVRWADCARACWLADLVPAVAGRAPRSAELHLVPGPEAA